MTWKEREEMFAKDVLTTDDLCALWGVKKSTAYNMMAAIKATNDRLGIRGIIHVQDYIDHFGLDMARYAKPDKDR